jgi:flagellin-like hook-associated protein FlgL
LQAYQNPAKNEVRMEYQTNIIFDPETEQEAENIGESLELIRKAEAALDKMKAILIEMQGLAYRASNEEAANAAALDRQFQHLKGELMATIDEADYGGYNLLDGSLGSLEEALTAIKQALGIAGEKK